MPAPRHLSPAPFLLLVAIFCALSGRTWAESLRVPGSGLESMTAEAHASWIQTLTPGSGDPLPVIITEPRSDAVLPANAASPLLAWECASPTVLVRIIASPELDAQAICTHKCWEPGPELWARLRAAARGTTITITINPVGGEDGRTILPGASTRVVIDENELLAPIAYLQLPVPFRTAKKHPQFATWRTAHISAVDAPHTFMTDLPVCANCHAYSADGSTMLLDMDVDGDKGGFVMSTVTAEVTMSRADCGSWNTLPATQPSPFSYGLFASLSPDGRYAAATVGETSLFVMIDRDDYSQLFFPVTGQISIFDRMRGTYALLPGTTDPGYVHTGPRFSPDAHAVAFSRAAVRPGYVRAVLDKTVLKESNDTTIHALNSRYSYHFDLCTVPFPNAAGSSPRPLPGASGNGKSNYFPRYSPNGKWIIFTQAPTGLVLQPGSRLCCIPAHGGEAHELSCNTERMNSWHSWSPDGKWMVFSAKGALAETELFLTRMYDNGTSSAALRLHRLSMPRFACVVPEFLPPLASQLRSVRLSFVQEQRASSGNNVR